MTSQVANPPVQSIRLLFSALLLVMLLSALDQTIVSTALPTIVGELDGLDKLSWVVTAYILSSTIAVPLYGKFGDLFGRKIVLQVAIGLFLVGSALCGLAQNMTQLVLMRGEGRLNVGGQTHHLRAGDVVLLPHGSPHLMESLVEWGQVLPVAHRFNGTVTEMRAGPAEGALEMLCGEFYFGPHVSWLFSEASTLIHLHTDAREDCPELDALLNILVRESLAQRPGGSAIVRSLGDTLLVLLLRMLLGEQQPPGGLLRLMSDERLMPAVLAVMATPEQPWTLESMAARAFLSRATFARHFARVYHLTPQAWLSQLRMALAARLLRLERQTNLEVIAERCGFQSLASFSKRFKMRYGVTPGEWRRG